jgi:hypothetical protein
VWKKATSGAVVAAKSDASDSDHNDFRQLTGKTVCRRWIKAYHLEIKGMVIIGAKGEYLACLGQGFRIFDGDFTQSFVSLIVDQDGSELGGHL